MAAIINPTLYDYDQDDGRDFLGQIGAGLPTPSSTKTSVRNTGHGYPAPETV